ncbi:hypothetical protein [Paenibacillus sp. FSL R7-0331]|uniref:hypothetical protein n=1 Tax=Paenibacillus sp. FSL R7-0331 TaxID=1536773 RepID=UPI0005A71DEC|nr:hypothetical protein [Paenibacillus sp. FSL R7-0331]
MTPHELNLHIESYNKRRSANSEELLINAYLNAYWHRIKRMPSLKEVLKKTQQQPQQTDEQMLAMVKNLNAAFGGTSG